MNEVYFFERFDAQRFVQQVFRKLLVRVDGFDGLQKIARKSRQEVFDDRDVVETLHVLFVCSCIQFLQV